MGENRQESKKKNAKKICFLKFYLKRNEIHYHARNMFRVLFKKNLKNFWLGREKYEMMGNPLRPDFVHCGTFDHFSHIFFWILLTSVESLTSFDISTTLNCVKYLCIFQVIIKKLLLTDFHLLCGSHLADMLFRN